MAHTDFHHVLMKNLMKIDVADRTNTVTKIYIDVCQLFLHLYVKETFTRLPPVSRYSFITTERSALQFLYYTS